MQALSHSLGSAWHGNSHLYYYQSTRLSLDILLFLGLLQNVLVLSRRTSSLLSVSTQQDNNHSIMFDTSRGEQHGNLGKRRLNFIVELISSRRKLAQGALIDI